MYLVSILETEEICHKRQPNNSQELKKKGRIKRERRIHSEAKATI